jgi:hypothetical protein
MVSAATSADVIVVLPVSVARLIVDEPTTTKLLASPLIVRTAALLVTDDAGTRVDVAILEVTVEPSELVVVTSIDVGSSVELGACEDTSEDIADDSADD